MTFTRLNNSLSTGASSDEVWGEQPAKHTANSPKTAETAPRRNAVPPAANQVVRLKKAVPASTISGATARPKSTRQRALTCALCP